MAEINTENMNSANAGGVEEVTNNTTALSEKEEQHKDKVEDTVNEDKIVSTDVCPEQCKTIATENVIHPEKNIPQDSDAAKESDVLTSENGKNSQSSSKEDRKSVEKQSDIESSITDIEPDNSEQVNNCSEKSAVVHNEPTVLKEESKQDMTSSINQEDLGAEIQHNTLEAVSENKDKTNTKDINNEVSHAEEHAEKDTGTMKVGDTKENVSMEVEIQKVQRISEAKESLERLEEHSELGIVGPPTTVSEVINEKERRAESALSANQKVQDHVAEWVENSAKVEVIANAEEEENHIQEDSHKKKDLCAKRSKKKKNNDAFPTRKSQRIVSNIIKKSIKCRLRRGAVPTIGVPVNVQPVTKMLVEDAKRSLLKVSHAKMLTGQKVTGNNGVPNSKQQHHQPTTERRQHHHQQHHQRPKIANQVNQEQKMAGIDVLLALGLKPAPRLNKMHAMEGAAGNGKKVDSAEKGREDDSSRASPKVPHSQQNGAALPEETAAAPATVECLRSATIKKEPLCDSESEIPTKSFPSLDSSQQKVTQSRCAKSEAEGSGRKRKSTDRQLSSNGNSAPKKFCIEQREQYISSLVGCEKITADELAARADQLRAEVQALDELARAKEMEWNEILSMRKLKEEAYLRVERRRQVLGYMEGNGQLADTLPPASLALGPEWESSGNTTPVSKEKCSFGSKEDLPEENSQDSPIYKKEKNTKQGSQRHATSPKQLGENSRKQVEALSPENRQIGEGRQGAIVDVRSIIADYRLRHPETVPRRGRRMRNSVNVGLGAGGAMVETGHNVDSRPSSTDSCKSNPNTADANNSMSFKDVLVQFAKLSQQQGEPVKTPQNYPDVTLHPVAPSPAPQNASPQQSGSLLHGILTKSQSPRPTTFSPTLARLLTAPERERNATTATSIPQQSAATQHLLQAYQGSNPVSISDLLSSSKARTEITITPVVNTPVQSHSNNLIHVDDVEEETAVIEDRDSRISASGRDIREDRDSPPRCQGCHERAAQFVCAGCGNQWYCSRECQVAAWDEHSEVCSG